MEVESKLDLLLKTMAENEKKRVSAEERNRADLLDLKAAVDGRLPQVEKRVEDLSTALGELNTKVEQIEGKVRDAGEKMTTWTREKEEGAAATNFNTPFQGTCDPHLASPSTFGFESVTL